MIRKTMILAGVLMLGAVGAHAQGGGVSPNLPINHPVMTPMAAPAPVMIQQPVQAPMPPVQTTVRQADPLAGVSLPNQRVGDAAYNGGGVVLEHGPDGVTRQIQ
ncbi:hypothetical protein EOD42_00300 [Rhodovarius crocodyli]|uniref:Uncharacterized protein n=1 Tax=Rhodovarius crocodyli TaxID=1979269 RepID=A0A437MLU8_9PROT|nr:hypothetical protein [Rhodovarius crocodyli]RVT98593.1 hypothetical protein EOD42_00300 [Rhodovarius crocodyli]